MLFFTKACYASEIAQIMGLMRKQEYSASLDRVVSILNRYGSPEPSGEAPLLVKPCFRTLAVG
jgi:hypothetical protein